MREFAKIIDKIESCLEKRKSIFWRSVISLPMLLFASRMRKFIAISTQINVSSVSDSATRSPTNYHYVLWYGADRTILVKHTDYKYEIPKNMPAPKWIYLSSLGPSAEAFHQDITRYLKAHPETKLSFQPGTFQISLGYEKLKAIYQRTECFFCNLDEAGRILKTDEKDVKKLLEGLHLLGPKIVAITDGPNGAYAYDGKEACFTPQYPDPKPPYDRTGAGDAFSSTFTVALSLGKTVPEALSWGPVNSMSVVQYVGAQKGLLSMGQLEKYLTNAPASYKISSI